jgi:hypothetical protein
VDAPVLARRALAFVIVGAILLAGGALSLAVTERDPAIFLFQHVLTIRVIAVILIWNLLAWSARRLIVGKLPELRLNSLTALVWGGSRVAFVIATVTVLVGWLIALALGLEIATAFIRAVVLLVVAMAFTGIIGGAFLNLRLAVRHLRGQGTQ